MMSKQLKKMYLNINGVDRLIVCDPEESLADLLRRIGLTSVKIGCGTAMCGSCTVLYDGVPVRSCCRKMKTVKEYTRIETVEGLGTASHLHPLQQAFITYSAIQCGFCTPGFIISAKGLLDVNPDPTRDEVREWFTKYRNVCRCTGYKQIIDAVMAAAAVMRGEKTMDDITWHMPEDGNIYGSDMPRPDATMLGKVLGYTDYAGDIAEKMPEGTLHLAVVQPDTLHARILSIDASEAEKLDGFVRLITAEDMKKIGTNRVKNGLGGPRVYIDGKEHPVICEDEIFHKGDIVAVVAAVSPEAARAAASLVKVELEELPAYPDYLSAVAPGAGQIHPQIEDSPLNPEPVPNVFVEQPLFCGKEDTREVIANSEYVVEGSFSTTRQPHLALEPDSGQAYFDEDGTLTIQYKSQTMYDNLASIYDALGKQPGEVRLILGNVGASFGFSMSPQMPALLGGCALITGHPVSLVLTYREHQMFTGKRSPLWMNTRYACDSEGHLTGIEFHAGLDHGAYSEMSSGITSKVCRFFGYPYKVPSERGLVQCAFTNHNFGIAYRAFGSPQVYTASEQMIDMLAEKAGMDPFEFRYINVARPGDLCPNEVPYREYPMQEMMDEMRDLYLECKERAEKESTPEIARGVGVAWGGYHVGKCPDHCELELELNADGSVTIYNCWQEMGQGGDIGTITLTYTALRPLGIRLDQIHMVQCDTKYVLNSGSSSASRSHQIIGNCTKLAADELIAAMKKDDGTYRTYDEMIAEGIPTRYKGHIDLKGVWSDIDPDTGHGWGAFAQNYMLFIAEVAVERTTGKTKVLALHCNADIGPIGNRGAVLGQAYSGMSHSIGYALSEDFSDYKKHTTIGGAGIPLAETIPDADNFDVRFHFTNRDNGPYGSTGCCEGFQTSGHVAILNAIYNATGVRIYDLPATPAKVKAGIDALAAGEPIVHEKWDMGCELYERLDYLKAHPVKEESAEILKDYS